MKLHPKLAKLLGIKEEANEDEISSAVDMMNEKLAKLHKEPDADDKGGKPDGDADDKGKQSNDAELTAKLAEAEAKLTEAKTLLTQSNDNLAAAKKQRIATSLDLAVAQGRVKIADHETELNRILALSNDTEITAELDKLRTADKRLKTESQTGDLAGAKDKLLAQSNDREEQRQALVNEEIAKLPKDMPEPKKFEMGWAAARRRKPSLFK